MDFVKYYPNVIERDVCALIVEELKEVTPLEGPTGSTRINGLDCISLKIDSDNFTFPLLAKAIKKIGVGIENNSFIHIYIDTSTWIL